MCVTLLIVRTVVLSMCTIVNFRQFAIGKYCASCNLMPMLIYICARQGFHSQFNCLKCLVDNDAHKSIDPNQYLHFQRFIVLTYASSLLYTLWRRCPWKMSSDIKVFVSVFGEKYAMFLIKTLFAQCACRGAITIVGVQNQFPTQCPSVSSCATALGSPSLPFFTCGYNSSSNHAYWIHLHGV